MSITCSLAQGPPQQQLHHRIPSGQCRLKPVLNRVSTAQFLNRSLPFPESGDFADAGL
jgi:hypothetical protein